MSTGYNEPRVFDPGNVNIRNRPRTPSKPRRSSAAKYRCAIRPAKNGEFIAPIANAPCARLIRAPSNASGLPSYLAMLKQPEARMKYWRNTRTLGLILNWSRVGFVPANAVKTCGHEQNKKSRRAVARSVASIPTIAPDSNPMKKVLTAVLALAAGFASGGAAQSPLSLPNEPNVWVKSPKNPKLTLGRASDFDSQNIMSPAIARDGGRYFLFYAGGPSGPKTGGELVRYQLGLALSDDGEIWTKTGRPLLPLGERDNFHATPALLRSPAGDLLKPDGRWHMVFCGNRADDVEHATSRDGLSWEKDLRSPIFKSAYAPNLVQVGEEIRMYYVHKPTTSDGKPRAWEIHLAVGHDFHALKPHPANPVLKLSQPWEKNHLFYPYVLREDETWVMFYAAYWLNHPTAGTATAIGIATSRDGFHWTKSPANPVLTPTPGSAFDSIYTSGQAVLRDGDRYRMYYASRIDMIHKYYAIGLATKTGRLVSPR